MRFDNRIRIALAIIEEYNFELPLSRFLLTYFRRNKQMGSRDRKIAANLIYSYYRLGNLLSNQSAEERLLAGQFLCNSSFNPLLDQVQPSFNQRIGDSLEEKLVYLKSLYPDAEEKDLFPFGEHFADGIEREAFIRGQLRQPNLYIRVREGHLPKLKILLNELEVAFEELAPTSLSFKNTTKLDHLAEGIIPKPFEIQDLSSQRTGTYFKPTKGEHWWDCCAASGGKSLMLMDEEPGVDLLASDVRASSLENLDERFKAAGIKVYKKKELDLLYLSATFPLGPKFDGIILDAPCTGSGTWARSPEMVAGFDPTKIEWFSKLQKKLATSVNRYLKVGKPLIYITCSAFKEENEDVMNYICSELNYQVECYELIKGYEHQADTMFVARLIKN